MKAFEVSSDYIGIVAHQTMSCDFCGAEVPCHQIHRTDDFLHLCSSCLRHLESLSDPIKGSVTKFLIGNLL